MPYWLHFLLLNVGMLLLQISVGVNTYGTIELENNSKTTWANDIHWVRALRLSDDCHSYNVQLRLLPSPKQSTPTSSILESSLLLQCVRPISPGQELLLWFSEEILAMLQIVFLTPANIQGTNILGYDFLHMFNVTFTIYSYFRSKEIRLHEMFNNV